MVVCLFVRSLFWHPFLPGSNDVAAVKTVFDFAKKYELISKAAGANLSIAELDGSPASLKAVPRSVLLPHCLENGEGIVCVWHLGLRLWVTSSLPRLSPHVLDGVLIRGLQSQSQPCQDELWCVLQCEPGDGT